MTRPEPLPLAETAGHDPSQALAEMRRGMADAAGKGMWSTAQPARETDIAGVRVLHHALLTPSPDAVVQFHGGGFRMGMPEAVGPYARRLADACSVDVYCPAYRLAPEYPFPAALNDGWAVLRALRERYEGRLILAGDSAGGGLAASLAAASAEAGIRVDGLILHSPWLDLTVTAGSYSTNEPSDPLFSQDAAREAAELYLQDRHSPNEPLVSPLFADPASFPPVLITVGSGEVLFDDGQSFHDRLLDANVACRLVRVEGMDHVAVTRGHDLPGADIAFMATQEFLGTPATR